MMLQLYIDILMHLHILTSSEYENVAHDGKYMRH
jgi:hypothetical protein